MYEDLNLLYIRRQAEKARVSGRRREDALHERVLSPGNGSWPKRIQTPSTREVRMTQDIEGEIHSDKNLLNAISAIQSGVRDHRYYQTNNDETRNRLRLAQLWRERGVDYRPEEIFGMTPHQLEVALDPNRGYRRH